MNIKHKFNNFNITLISILCSLAIVLSIIESALPQTPFMPPGAKIGLSNIVVMYSAGTLGFSYSILISIIKSIFAGVTRGFTAFLMSSFGGISSAIITTLLFKIKKINYITIGIIGALIHNFFQLFVAMFLASSVLLYYVPFIILFSLISGSITGFIFKILSPFIQNIHNS